VDVIDDPESADASTLDLTPRPQTAAVPASGRRRAVTWAAGVVVLVAIGWVVAQGLSGATTFFYNVDDALAKREDIGDRRVRIQGNVLDGTVDASGEQGVTFTLAFGGKTVGVDLTGDVPDLFATGIPVVVEGRFEGDRFEADDVLIRHDATYDEENPQRQRDAERDADANDAGGDVQGP
jgi:cytochrome c-type biogenesis protein CcmE